MTLKDFRKEIVVKGVGTYKLKNEKDAINN